MTETENTGKIITYLPKSKIAKTSWKRKKLKVKMRTARKRKVRIKI